MFDVSSSLEDAKFVALEYLQLLAPDAHFENIQDPFLIIHFLREVVTFSGDPEALWALHVNGFTEKAEEVWELVLEASQKLQILDVIYNRELNKLIYPGFDDMYEKGLTNWL